MTDDLAEIYSLIEAFFSVFTTVGGAAPAVGRVQELCLPAAVVVKAAVTPPEVFTLRDFVETRVRILSDGQLLEFEEREVEHRTAILGNIAQRRSLYHKTGLFAGRRFETRGAKVFQLVRTPRGWRLSALAWDDEREGFSPPLHLDPTDG